MEVISLAGALLLLLTFGQLWAICYGGIAVSRGSLRRSFVFAALAWAWLAVAVAEGLSAFGALDAYGYLASYGLLALLGMPSAVGYIRRLPRAEGLRAMGAYTGWHLALLLVLVLVLMAGFGALPNTTDGLTYHLPRMEFWLQNRNVYFFPTPDLRQVGFAPGYAYVMMPFRALTEYHLLFVPQFVGFVACGVSTSLLTQAFGRPPREQLLAAAWVGCTPLAVAEASGTFNDLQVGASVVTGAWLTVLGLGAERNYPLRTGVLLGMTLGLGFWLKSTVVFYALPLVLWAVGAGFRHHRFWTMAMLAAGTGAILTLGLWIRNEHSLGDPLGTSPSLKSYNAQHPVTPGTVVSNTLRFHGAQFMVSGQPEINAGNTWVLEQIHRGLGLPLDAPETLFEGRTYRGFSPSLDEQVIPHLVAWPLVMGVGVWLVRTRRWYLFGYWLAVQAVVWVMGSLLKWQPFAGRFLLAWFFLAAPLVVAWVSHWRRSGQIAVGILLVGFALWTGLRAQPRRLLPGGNNLWNQPARGLFYYRASEAAQYQAIVHHLLSAQVDTVGLAVGFNEVISPFWILTRSAQPPPVFLYTDPHPEALVATNPRNRKIPDPDWQVASTAYFRDLEARGFVPVTDSASVRLYRRAAPQLYLRAR